MNPNIAPLFGAHCLYEMHFVSMLFCYDLFVIVRGIERFVMGNILITNAFDDSYIYDYLYRITSVSNKYYEKNTK